MDEQLQEIARLAERIGKDLSQFERETSQSLQVSSAQGEHILVVLGRQIENLRMLTSRFNEVKSEVESINSNMTEFFDELDEKISEEDTRIDNLESYTGSGGSPYPFFSSSYFISGADSLEEAISMLDQQAWAISEQVELMFGVQDEVQYINNFIGKSAGDETPEYSSTVYVAQGVDLETAIGQLDSGVWDLDYWATINIHQIGSFIGRSANEYQPSYSSTFYVMQGDPLEDAIGELDAALCGVDSDLGEEKLNRINEDGYIQDFVGKTTFGPESPQYSSTVWVVQGSSLEEAIGELDQGLSLAWDQFYYEDDYIRAFIGKSGMGSVLPSYSSSFFIIQGSDLETAIGDLDASLEEVSSASASEESAIRAFIGKDAVGLEMPSYASQFYIASGTSLEQAISDLDIALAATNDNLSNEGQERQLEDAYIHIFIGKNDFGSELPSYSSTFWVSQNANLEEAISELDAALEEVSSGSNSEEAAIRAFIGKGEAGVQMPSYTSTNYIGQGVDLESAISSLDSALANIDGGWENEDAYIRSFIGKSAPGSESPSYSSIHYVVQSSNLESAIGQLDASLYDLDEWIVGEVDDLNSFTGRAAGQSSPSYSSIHYVTQSADLETAIGQLDASLADLDNWTVGEVDDLNSFTGRAPGQSSPSYSSTNYVSSGSPLENAIGDLDSALKDLDSEIASVNSYAVANRYEIQSINLYIGKIWGDSTPSYSSSHFLSSSSEAVDEAISDLDYYLYRGLGFGSEGPMYWSSWFVSGTVENAISQLDSKLREVKDDVDSIIDTLSCASRTCDILWNCM